MNESKEEIHEEQLKEEEEEEECRRGITEKGEE